MEIKYRLHDKQGQTIGFEEHKKNEHGCYQIWQTSIREDWSTGDTKNVREGYFIAATHKCMSLNRVDINGNEIFENDIVWDDENMNRNKIVYDERSCSWLMSGLHDEWDDFLHNFKIEKIEVLGNILDNPDLITI